MFENIGQMLILLWRTLLALPLAGRQKKKIFDQLFEIGNASLLMACVLSLFIGGVLALQTGPVLAGRGLTSFVGQIVGLSMCKELAPVMMAVLIAGRIGSAMAAEIGSMAVYQEIDALRTLNINPVHYLVMPRSVAIAGIDLMDVANGLIKSVFFAVVIGMVSCHQGLQTAGGPRGIGRSVTKAVVNSIVLILILDYFLTRILMHFDR